MAQTGVDDTDRRTAVRWAGVVIVVLILIWLAAMRTGTPRPTAVAGGQAPGVSSGEVAPAATPPAAVVRPGVSRAEGRRP